MHALKDVKVVKGSVEQDEKALQEEGLASERYVPRVMPSIVGGRDLLACYIVATFLITNAVLQATGGVVALTYTILGAVAFFLPCVIATAQLGAMYPHEGSLYNWTYHALGRFWGFFVGLCYWLSGVLAPVTAANAFVTILAGLNNNWLTQPWQQGCAMVILLVFGSFLCTRRLRVVLNIVNVAALSLLVAVLVIVLAAGVWIWSGHGIQADLLNGVSWRIDPNNFSLFSVVTLSFIGASGPMNMAGELREPGNKRLTVAHLFGGTPVVFACYFLVPFAILVVFGQGLLGEAVPSFAGVHIIDMVFGKVVGSVIAVITLLSCLASIVFYIGAAARLLFVAGIDNFLPRNIAYLNKHRQPVVAIRFHTFAALLVVVVVFVILPYVVKFGTSTSLVSRLYAVLSAVLTIIWTVATAFYFINLLSLCFGKKWHEQLKKQKILPRPVLMLIVVVGLVTCLATVCTTFIYPWSDLIRRDIWIAAVGGITAVCLIIAINISMLAHSEARWESMRDG
ncbi:APC family permease [Ktedonospora formicarum]|uniref:Amino acid permease n=1 Tax=Ktedonospora formicarum TaxID=2778364 RepID=A0A8J3HZE8_9CHLR|nr:APC family permease [Ktedonospora formicarum]GHO43323.1 hypothetical protein KSX_14860 [Ktedonospora formicarum]